MARPCPACQFSDSRPKWSLTDRLLGLTREAHDYRECLSCRSLFMDPLPDLSNIQSFYPGDYWWLEARGSSQGWLSESASVYRQWVVRDHLRYLKRIQRQESGEGPPLLDVGCGSGTFLAAARSAGFRVTGLDSSATAVEHLRRSGFDAVMGTLTSSGLGDRKFPVMTLFHVLEHLRDPLPELRALLDAHATAGANIIIQVPNLTSLQAKLMGARWHGLDPPRHLTQFTSLGLAQLVEDAGLRMVRRYHFSLRDQAPAIVSSLFPAWDPVGLRVREGRHPQRHEGRLRTMALYGYGIAVLLALPGALFESACRRGGTLVVHAQVVH